jgi:hypothetical protein
VIEMERGYCFMAINKINNKVSGKLSSAHQHNYRTKKVINADPEKIDCNDELVSLNGLTYREAIKKRLEELGYGEGGKTVRSNSVLAYEILTEFPSRKLSNIDVEKWKSDQVEWLRETFNADAEKYGDNVLSVMFHGDEAGNVHCHSIVIPIDNKGNLNASFYTDGKMRLVELQNTYGKLMEKNHNLKRGLENSVASHESMKNYYKVINRAIRDAKECPLIEEKDSYTKKDVSNYHKKIVDWIEEENFKHVGERRKLERKVVEAKTFDLNKHLVYTKEIDSLNQKLGKYEELEREFGPVGTLNAKLTTLHQLNDGMKKYIESHPDEEKAIIEMNRNMQRVITWKKEEDGNKKKEKKKEVERK